MELSVKDWMIIIGVVLLAVVLFDGLRRVINDRRNNIRMRAKPVYHEEKVDLELTSHEIQGNARIVLRADGSPMPFSEQQRDSMREVMREQKVPVLLEPAEDLKGKKSRRKKKEKIEPVAVPVEDDIQLTIDVFADDPVQSTPKSTTGITEPAARRSVYESYDEDDYDDEDQAADASLNELLAEQPASRRDHRAAAYEAAPSSQSTSQTSAQQSSSQKPTPQQSTQQQSTGQKARPATQEQDVVVMHVLARDNAGFKGTDLMQILLGCDMRYGRMNIFHRYEDGSTEEIQFSVANLVEPGTFDLDALHHFTTPGVSFFMTLPGPEKPLQAFDYMAATAQEIARHLDGEILDERKRILNDALIAERRQSIQQYAVQTAAV